MMIKWTILQEHLTMSKVSWNIKWEGCKNTVAIESESANDKKLGEGEFIRNVKLNSYHL